jgi:hypothetical protein
MMRKVVFASVKQREQILLRGRAARPASLWARPWGGGCGQFPGAIQEWQQVIGVHVVQLK